MDSQSKRTHLLTLAVGLAVIAALNLARDVLIPFALAALVTFLLSPLVLRLHRWGLPKIVAVGLAMLLLLSGVGSLGWIVVNEARDFAKKWPEYQVNIQQKVSLVRGAIQTPFGMTANPVDDSSSETDTAHDAAPAAARDAAPDAAHDAAPDAARDATPAAAPKEKPKEKPNAASTEATPAASSESGPFETLRSVIGPVLFTITMLAMALLLAAVMLLRPEDVRDRVIRLVGRGKISLTTRAFDEASSRVSVYLGRQLLVNGILGACLGVGLLIIGVPDALLWGLLLVCLRFVPYVGTWIAALFPIAVSLATSSGASEPLQTLGLFVTLEFLGGMVLEPWLFSAGTGITPLAVLLSTLFWSWMWGPVGLILATPITVCLVVVGKYVPQLHFLYLLFSDTPALPPSARLYQRLLAKDHEEAWNIMKIDGKEKSVRAAYDSILLPALAMAESERSQGSVDDEAVARVQAGVQLLITKCHEPEAMGVTPVEETESPRLRDMRVLCMPARNAADVLATRMLDQLLQLAQAKTEVAPLAEFVGETIERFEVDLADVVVISVVPPSRFMHVRYICKRLALQYPELEIIVGMWTMDLDDPLVRERAPVGPRVHVVTSLKAALVCLGQIQQQARIRREAGGTPRAHSA